MVDSNRISGIWLRAKIPRRRFLVTEQSARLDDQRSSEKVYAREKLIALADVRRLKRQLPIDGKIDSRNCPVSP